MNPTRFDTWTIDLTLTDRPRSRRWAVAHVAGAVLGGLVATAGLPTGRGGRLQEGGQALSS